MHPSVDPSCLSILANGTVPYKRMHVSQILEIRAKDSRTGRPGKFRVQVVGFGHDNLNSVRPAVFRLLDNFGFFQRNSDPARIEAGATMLGGTSEFHLPVSSGMSYVGGIAIGRDHSFEYVDGEHEALIIAGIQDVREIEVAERFDFEDLTAYWEAVEYLKARLAAERKVREEQLRTAARVLVRTANSTYEFGPADRDGVRPMKKLGGQTWTEAKLLFAERGRQMCFSVNDNGGWKHGTSSLVQEVILDAA